MKWLALAGVDAGAPPVRLPAIPGKMTEIGCLFVLRTGG